MHQDSIVYEEEEHYVFNGERDIVELRLLLYHVVFCPNGTLLYRMIICGLLHWSRSRVCEDSAALWGWANRGRDERDGRGGATVRFRSLGEQTGRCKWRG